MSLYDKKYLYDLDEYESDLDDLDRLEDLELYELRLRRLGLLEYLDEDEEEVYDESLELDDGVNDLRIDPIVDGVLIRITCLQNFCLKLEKHEKLSF